MRAGKTYLTFTDSVKNPWLLIPENLIVYQAGLAAFGSGRFVVVGEGTVALLVKGYSLHYIRFIQIQLALVFPTEKD